jgi:hypothetical protein
MPDLHFSISFRVILLLLVAVCSVLIAIFVYRYTVPPISQKIKSVLISLRSVGMFLLFLLLGEPLLLLITHSVDQPIAAVLVDDSKSMAIHDKSGHRSELLKSVLKSDIWRKIDKHGKVLFLRFDSKVRDITGTIADSLTQRGDATDIAEAFKSIKQKFTTANLQSVVLVSDGNPTVGMNPLYEAEDLGVPVFTVGVGDTSEQKDLLIRKVISNEIVYAGTKVPINVTLHSAGFGRERVRVSLHDGAVALDEKYVMLEQGARNYIVPFSFIPDKEGLQKYNVEVPALSGELTAQNNRMSFFVKVLKSKMKVALVAGAPSQDAVLSGVH